MIFGSLVVYLVLRPFAIGVIPGVDAFLDKRAACTEANGPKPGGIRSLTIRDTGSGCLVNHPPGYVHEPVVSVDFVDCSEFVTLKPPEARR